jgi:hypothetical protein
MLKKNLLSLHEAIVIALITRPARSASFKEIADFILRRNLYPIRKGNIPLEKQVMLRATKAKGAYHHLFIQEGNDVIRLKDSNIDFPLQLFNALEALLDFDRKFFNPDSKSISLIVRTDDTKEIIKRKLSPADVICILSHKKSREKKFYVVERSQSGGHLVKSYIFNNQKYNFETLCKYLDPLSHHLTMAARNTIVNVAFYNLVRKNLLQVNINRDSKSEYFQVKMSSKSKEDRFIQEFKILKEAHNRRILLQKAALGYKTEMSL